MLSMTVIELMELDRFIGERLPDLTWSYIYPPVKFAVYLTVIIWYVDIAHYLLKCSHITPPGIMYTFFSFLFLSVAFDSHLFYQYFRRAS